MTKTKTIEIHYENLVACLETFLRSVGVITDDEEVVLMDLDLCLNENDMVEIDIEVEDYSESDNVIRFNR